MENVKIDEKIYELLNFCFTNKIEFMFQKEENENYISIKTTPNISVVLNISDPDDKNLGKLLDDKLVELNQLFK